MNNKKIRPGEIRIYALTNKQPLRQRGQTEILKDAMYGDVLGEDLEEMRQSHILDKS